MEKNEILQKIKEVTPIKGRNSMGVSESYYNPYYLIREHFGASELERMSGEELNRLVKFADYVTNVFY